MLTKSTDYGLTVTDPSLLRVANTPNTQFLLQAELRAIHNGLQYIEVQVNEELTYNYPTATSAHLVLEQVIEIQCMLAKSTDYGLTATDPSLIRVANTPNTQFLLQAELRAIQMGL